MAADPLSIPATILPESSFDPVQFAKERRQEVLTEQKERRERYNKAWESVGTPSDWNRNVQQELMDERNQVFDAAAAKSAQGINLTDISHPKYGKDAMEFSNKLKSLNMKIDQSNALDEYLATLRNTIAKDVNKVIDVDATNKNIATLKSLKSFDEINKFMSEKGDDLLVLKKPEFNMDQYISDYIKKSGITSIKSLEETPKGNFLISEMYNLIPPEKLQGAFMGMLQDPTFKSEVKAMRDKDMTDLRGGSDLDYLMERKGNSLARQQTGLEKKWIKPTGTDKEEEKPNYQVTNKTSSLRMGSDDIPVDDLMSFDQSKSFGISLANAIDPSTGRQIGKTDNADFTPRRLVDVKVLKADTKIKGVVYKKGTIIRNPDTVRTDLVETKRFVEGYYKTKVGKTLDDKTYVVDSEKTILKPYSDIKSEMDMNYKIGDDVSKQKIRYKNPTTGKIYDIPGDKEAEILKTHPELKKL